MWAERRICEVKPGGAYSDRWALNGWSTAVAFLTLKGFVLPTQCIYLLRIIPTISIHNIIPLALQWRCTSFSVSYELSFCTLFRCVLGSRVCTVAEAVSRRPLTADAPVRSQVSPRGICGGRSGTVTGPPPCRVLLSAFPLSVFFHQCSLLIFIYTLLLSGGGWSLGTFKQSNAVWYRGSTGLTSTFSLFFRLSFSFSCQWNRLFLMKANRHGSLRVTSVRVREQSDCLTIRFVFLNARSQYVAGRYCGRPASWFKVFRTFAQPHTKCSVDTQYPHYAAYFLPLPRSLALSQFPRNEALRR